MIELNEFQTPIDDAFLSDMPQECRDDFFNVINSVPYVQNLISKDRPRAKDLPRDEKGRIIVDIANPHILENMDYFRPSALHFQEYGTFTDYRINGNPNSEFMKWFKEEVRRCWEGYVRESDGEWVTGYLYYFLNYSPILLTKMKKGQRHGQRVFDFPEVWEGIYLRFHYLEQSRRGGKYDDFVGAKHSAELASRGKGKSFSLASLLSHDFVLGENSISRNSVTDIVTAYQKEYLTKDGVLNKFVSMIDFVSENTQFPRRRLKESGADMTWTMGYIDADTGVQKGTRNTVIGVTSKDDISKMRGKRANKILIEEFGSFKNLIQLYQNIMPSVTDGEVTFGQVFALGCVCAGTKVWCADGTMKNIEDLKKEDGIIGWHKGVTYTDKLTVLSDGLTIEPIGKVIEPKVKQCVRVTLSNGNYIECSDDHPILSQKVHTPRTLSYKLGNKRKRVFEEFFVPASKLKIGDRVCESRYCGVFGNGTLFDARLVGMLIGDGTYGYDNTPKFSSEDAELLNYVKERYKCGLSATHITKMGFVYEDIRVNGICKYLREIGIYGQTKTNKRLPNDFMKLDRESSMLLLSGLYDTDGTIVFRKDCSNISITQSTKEILEQIQLLWRKFGVVGAIHRTEPRISENRKDKNPYYSLCIGGRNNILNASKILSLLVKHKVDKLKEVLDWFDSHKSQKECGYDERLIVYKITNIERLGERTIYNLSACSSHTYLANGIITHNTAGDSDSDFEGASELMYNPVGYNMYNIPNVYDKVNSGKPRFVYFFPAYLNRKGCYNEDGVSDVTAALKALILNRYKTKYNTTDPRSIVKTIAEYPITPAEAIIRTNGSQFPITDLSARLGQIDSDPDFYSSTYVGDLVMNNSGIVEYVPNDNTVIRTFPHKDNKNLDGAIEMYELPVIDRETGKAMAGRYIAGCDPYDDDESSTTSLGCIIIMDIMTDRIVAEYTGRPAYAYDFYEICRKMCIFYNAKVNYEQNKKGIFSYFSQMNCLYLMTDTLEFLKDKCLQKESYGNKSKGTVATLPINSYARTLINQWLRTPMEITEETADGKVETTRIPKLYSLRGRAMILELINWNEYGNFDRVSALGMLMLLREDRMITLRGDASNLNSGLGSDEANDPFFDIGL